MSLFVYIDDCAKQDDTDASGEVFDGRNRQHHVHHVYNLPVRVVLLRALVSRHLLLQSIVGTFERTFEAVHGKVALFGEGES